MTRVLPRSSRTRLMSSRRVWPSVTTSTTASSCGARVMASSLSSTGGRSMIISRPGSRSLRSCSNRVVLTRASASELSGTAAECGHHEQALGAVKSAPQVLDLGGAGEPRLHAPTSTGSRRVWAMLGRLRSKSISSTNWFGSAARLSARLMAVRVFPSPFAALMMPMVAHAVGPCPLQHLGAQHAVGLCGRSSIRPVHHAILAQLVPQSTARRRAGSIGAAVNSRRTAVRSATAGVSSAGPVPGMRLAAARSRAR